MCAQVEPLLSGRLPTWLALSLQLVESAAGGGVEMDMARADGRWLGFGLLDPK